MSHINDFAYDSTFIINSISPNWIFQLGHIIYKKSQIIFV